MRLIHGYRLTNSLYNDKSEGLITKVYSYVKLDLFTYRGHDHIKNLTLIKLEMT